MVLISVIIPTFRDSSRLEKCLGSINQQSEQDFKFEVIVSNNDPADKILREHNYSFDLKVVSEAMAGSYAARNKAIIDAKGEYLLFTDSDCIPDKNWLKEANRAIQEREEEIIAGKVEVFSYSRSKYGKFEKAFAFPNEEYVRKEGYGVTANLLVNSKVIKSIGGFRQGLLTGGDSEFCNRALQKGFTITYFEGMKVFHPARETWNQLKTKAKRFGGKIPKDDNRLLVFIKILGKYRLRNKDLAAVKSLKNPLSEKVSFLMIIARIRWVEATESLRVFPRKQPGRL